MSPPRLSWSVTLLYGLLRIAGRLPLPVLHALGAAVGRWSWRWHGRTRRITENNLSLVLTQESVQSRHAIGRAAVIETGKSLCEIAKIWGNSPENALELVRAEGAGVRTLYRRLAAGGVVGILPDQKPRHGEGVLAPFFGVPAATP